MSYGSRDISILIQEGQTFGGPMKVDFREKKNRKKKKLLIQLIDLFFNWKSPKGFFIVQLFLDFMNASLNDPFLMFSGPFDTSLYMWPLRAPWIGLLTLPS